MQEVIRSRLCRESPLTPWTVDTLAASPGDGVFHPRGLPHGECGVRGSAPRSGGSVRRRVGSEDDQDDFLLCALVAGAEVRKERPSMRKVMQ